MTDAIVGLDIGTTQTKAVVIGTDGTVFAQAGREATLVSLRPNWAEQDADEWWRNTQEILQELTAAVRGRATIRAVGVSGMVPALVVLGDDGRPLRRSIQQNDARTANEIAELKAAFGDERFFALTGGSINQQVLAPKLRWLAKHEPDVLERARRLCGSYDYIAYRLTGHLWAEHNWALESGLCDIASGDWSPELVELAGITPDLLPVIRASHEVVGEVQPDAAEATGLAAGTPVIAGVADHVASAFTATVTQPGDLLVKFGGAGDVLYSLDRLVTDPRLFIDHHIVPGAYYLNGCMATSGSLVKWFTREFCQADAAAAALAGAGIYAYLDGLAAALPPGSDGLVVLPYFLGEKTPLHDPYARGTIVGLGLHHGRHHLFRAVLEAVAYGFRHHVDVLAERDLPVRRVLASDGGAASDLWLQLTADVLGRPVHRVLGHPGSSLGAAFVAGKAVELFDGWGDIERFVVAADPFEPQAAAHAAYQDFYALFRDTYERLASLYPRLVRARDAAEIGRTAS
jgi:xylulokinase